MLLAVVQERGGTDGLGRGALARVTSLRRVRKRVDVQSEELGSGQGLDRSVAVMGRQVESVAQPKAGGGGGWGGGGDVAVGLLDPLVLLS